MPRHGLPAHSTRDVGGRIGQTYTHAINGFQFTGSAAAAEALRRNPNVVSVTPDRPIALTAETLPTGIERIAAYDKDTPLTGAYHNGYRGNGAPAVARGAQASQPPPIRPPPRSP